jgi:hypothetical protein
MSNTDDIKSAKHSAEFVSAFSELAKRLVEIGVAVNSLTLSWGAFGSWDMEVVKGDQAFRFTFEGKDYYFTIDGSPIQQYNGRRRWKRLEERSIPRGQLTAISRVEVFLRDKFEASSN